ncbi:hypothetical protein CHS0354_022520 [Potamilus streckersoni]|uniref:Uncharacterized protein n=1 Tax=Potamilus streckersoni TaxID=2493646 RepID=A0AAE0VQL9_9BIVA|nr:hypothetical protein CHS0354_022520 [Potamilus streckersoni]
MDILRKKGPFVFTRLMIKGLDNAKNASRCEDEGEKADVVFQRWSSRGPMLILRGLCAGEKDISKKSTVENAVNMREKLANIGSLL